MKHTRGFTLPEVMMAIAISGVLLMATLSIIRPLLQLKTQVDANSGLLAATMYMRDCITNEGAWTNTLSYSTNSSMACLSSSTVPCTNALAPQDVTLMSTGSQFCLQNYNTASTSSTGLTAAGTVCTGFTSAGNDNCPYRLDVKWQATCPMGGGTCFNPIVTVTGQMRYAGLAQKKTVLNLNKFQINVIRGRADPNRFFSIYETQNSGTGGGNCAASSYRMFAFNSRNDPGGYIQNVDSSGAVILQPGSYDCHISVPGFAVGNYKTQLVDTSRNVTLLQGTSEFAPLVWGNTQTRSEIEGTFTLNQLTHVAVVQYCAGSPPNADATTLSWTRGVPASHGTEIYTVMNCTVLARSIQ